MTGTTVGRPDHVHAYLEQWGYREPPILARLREETAALPNAQMQIAPEQGAVLALLVELTGGRRCLEIGTFTGYSSLAMALAMPADGMLICCDVSEVFTSVARRYWADAGVADRVDLRLGPALDTLDGLLASGGAGTFDVAFIDADKTAYPAYWERCLELVRSGGVIAIDNVFRRGDVADPAAGDPDTVATRQLNEMVAGEDRVRHVMLGIADGMTIARKR